MKSKKGLIAIIAVTLIAMGVLVGMALMRDFDAEKYVSVILDQTFQGKVEGATEIIDGITEEELYQQYEDGVTAFVKNNIISGVEVDAEAEAKFIELGKKIFGSMKYETVSVEKISKDEYDVKVSYQPADVFLKYIEYINLESQKITDKVEAGEYKGTVDEINAQMENEFIASAYTLLEQAYTDMEFGEASEMEFVVKVGATELYQLREDELQELMVKIMRLDEIQD